MPILVWYLQSTVKGKHLETKQAHQNLSGNSLHTDTDSDNGYMTEMTKTGSSGLRIFFIESILSKDYR